MTHQLTAIEVERLAKTYEGPGGGVVAVEGITFAVQNGEIFGLLGPNGAGKTTTVHMLATLLRPSAGTARIVGHDLWRDAAAIRSEIGVALQQTGLDNVQTGRQLITFIGRLHGFDRIAAQARAEELLDLVGLNDAADRRVRTYSGGMRRRLDLALALVHRPRLLYLDEPTTGLDPAARRAVWNEVEELRAGGITILLTTQYMEEADRLCDRIAILDAGSIAAEGEPEELKRSFGGDVIEIDMRDRELAVEAATLLGDGASVEEDRVRLTTPNGSARIPQVIGHLQRKGLEPEALTLARPTLDDVFLDLTGRRLQRTGTSNEEVAE